MLLTVLSGWAAFVGKRRIEVELVPESVRKIWNEWELRATVLLSLTTQIILIAVGSRRRSSNNIWVRSIVWCAYLTADWAATLALGAISNAQVDSNTDALTAFWAPFLLLHLGGPDTITAYALEDNQLWLRQLLGAIVQLFGGLYVVLTAWTGGWLSWLSIPLLIAGAIKCVERSWVLRGACRERFELASNSAHQALMLKFGRRKDTNSSTTKSDTGLFLDSYNFFQAFSSLFVDSISMELSFLKMSQQYFNEFEFNKAFTMVEIELGFAYDAFYTKAPIVYTTLGFITRLLTFSLTVFVFVFFWIRAKKNIIHPNADLIVSYILLVGAIGLELFGFILLLLSEWTIVRFLNLIKSPFSHKVIEEERVNSVSNSSSVILLTHHIRTILKGQRWSKSMGQYNILSYCLKQCPFSNLFHTLFPKWLPGYESLENYFYTSHCSVSEDLKSIIFEHFKEKVSQFDKLEGMTELYEVRGQYVLDKYEDTKELRWIGTKVGLDVSIIIWHIVTDLCFYFNDDDDDDYERYKKTNKHCKESKKLSDYIMYLLVTTSPDMLPIQKENIENLIPKLCSEIESIIKKEMNNKEDFHIYNLSKTKVSSVLVDEASSIRPGGIQSKYLLRPAARIAKFMMEEKRKEKRWEIICNVWIEILGYVATHCDGYYYHSQHLRKGGELVTHVWLLMAHLGITDKFLRSGGPFADFLLQTPYLFES